MSQFAFLEAEFADEFVMAEWAERHALSDPGPAAIYARKCLESGVKWAFEHDRALPVPYEDKFNTYLNEPRARALRTGSCSRSRRRSSELAIGVSPISWCRRRLSPRW